MRSILALLSILISYGSLYPFNFTASEAFPGEFQQLFSDLSIPSNRGDLFGNIVLFIPFGVVASLIAARAQRRWALSVFLFLLGLLLAFGVQVLQIWLPSRDASAGDAVVNMVGFLLGFILGFWIKKIQPEVMENQHALMLVPATLCFLWIAYRWFPWIPTLDLQNIKSALKPLLALSEFNFVRSLHTAVAWLTFFKLSEFLRIKHLQSGVLILAALAITLLQVVFLQGTISLNNVAGVALAILAMPLLARPTSLAAVCLALMATILITGLQPFQFADPLNRFNWIPFTGFLSGVMSVNALVLLEKTFLYGALIYLLQKNGAQLVPSTILVAAWLTIIEFLQIFIQGRTAEITDPIWALLTGYIIGKVGKHETLTQKK